MKRFKMLISVLLGAPDKPCGVGRADANPKGSVNRTVSRL